MIMCTWSYPGGGKGQRDIFIMYFSFISRICLPPALKNALKKPLYTPHNFALGALQSSTRNLRFSSSAPLRKNDGKIPVNGDLEKSGTVKSAGRSSYEPMRTSRSSCMRPYLLLLTSRRTKHLPDVV